MHVHDMTRSINGVPPQDAQNRPHTPQKRRKRVAALPDLVPAVLIRDSVFLENPSIAWPRNSLDRRQLFQSLLNKYYRQIRYGCENSNCDVPTCLSWQRKTSKGPFRRFTVLSARTLACFLAAQDDPEKDLCPHQPAFPLEASGAGLRYRTVTKAQSPVGKVSSRSNNHHRHDAYDIAGASNPHLTDDAGKRKDPKSFTQNLFDTVAMKMLQITAIPSGFLQWTPWLGREERAGPDSDVANVDPSDAAPCPRKKHLTRNAQDPNSHGHRSRRAQLQASLVADETLFPPNLPSNPLSAQKFKKAPQFRSHEHRRAIHNSDAASSLTGRQVNLSATDQLPTMSEDPEIQEQNDTRGSQDDGDLENRRGHQQANLDAEEAYKKAPVDFTQSTHQGDKSTTSETDCEIVQPPQSLSHFSFENIVALGRTIIATNPILHREHLFWKYLGRMNLPGHASTLVSGADGGREGTLAFRTQSITYILSTPTALLRSFRTSTVDQDQGDMIQSVGSHKITVAFRILMTTDYYPHNIIPSLWIGTGKILSPGSFPMKSPTLKASRFNSVVHLDNHASGNARDEPELNGDNFLNDNEAAHILKIALAALFATMPDCTADMWTVVRVMLASGRVAPGSNVLPGHERAARSIMGIMDSFQDDMSLSLVKRIVRVISTRRCISEMARNQGIDAKKQGWLANGDLEILEILFRYIANPDHAIEFTTQANVSKSRSDCVVSETELEAELTASYGKDLSIEPSFASVTVEWLRNLVLKEWDGKAEIARWGAVGGAVEFLAYLYDGCNELHLSPEIFQTPFLSERLDAMEMPTQWLSLSSNRNTTHLLSYPFLFPLSALVSYFRAINHAAMYKAFEGSLTTTRMVMQMNFADPVTNPVQLRLYDRLKTAMTNYLVLQIRRGNVLTDALNQLWRRERRELMKPLKVRMGMEEGEEGVDHGGVQQEFFRVAISEALNPEYGLFTTDDQTRFSWFQPCSLEPLYKFELIGLLTSLAIYNGLTLPINFPLALYRKLLDMPVTSLAHIQDGWPDLAKGLRDLETWSDGDVEDVFMRSYVFSAKALGSNLFIDMERIGREDNWPPVEDKGKGKEKAVVHDQKQASQVRRPKIQTGSSSRSSTDGWGWTTLEGLNTSSEEKSAENNPNPSPSNKPSQPRPRPRTDSTTSQANMVTNANRIQYISDYIFWLTDKSIRSQYDAFARGFYVCLDKKATSIFTPEALRSVVEGIQTIDVDALQQTARYEGGYTADHDIIRDFWQVVRGFAPEKVRLLLEFVTASERIPVNGVRSILFVIQRNGDDDHRLPTSLTCFGRLLLPEYSSRGKLEERLMVAIENCKGFGVA